MGDSDLESRFQRAVWLIRNGPKDDKASNDQKLQFYSYYKQATEGDVKGSQPWAVNFEARAKWNAWNKLKGVSKEEAMQGYLDLMGDPSVWESHELLQQYPGPQWMAA